MTPEEKYELFEKYCSEELSAEEKAELDKMLNEDATLQKELRLYQELHSHLDTTLNTEHELLDLKKNLKQIADTYTENTIPAKKSKVIKLPVWSYAAAASVAILFGIYFLNPGNPSYTDFANIPELSIVERATAEEDIKGAENAFNTKDFATAEKYLDRLLKKDANNTEFQYYYGIALLEQDKFDMATKVFGVLLNGNSAYKYKAQWFEALNQLKQEKYEECMLLLKGIPEQSEDYDTAQKLLKKLE